MPVTPYLRFRLGERTLADLDALATSAGTRSQACREALAYWRQAVESAGRQNAEDLSAEDWERLAHLNNPEPPGYDEEERAAVLDWSQRLAVELCGMWEGRSQVLPRSRAEMTACKALARRIAPWGLVRGYALFACLRHFWRHQETPKEWWQVEVWMAPAEPREED